MAGVNPRRIALGGLAGAVVWNVWSGFIYTEILGPRYPQAQAAGYYLKQPRYPGFAFYWIVTLFVVSYMLSWFYAGMRDSMGPGPSTALRIGFFAGFIIAFPLSLAELTWLPADPFFAVWHMLELWVGAILATFVAGWIYKD